MLEFAHQTDLFPQVQEKDLVQGHIPFMKEKHTFVDFSEVSEVWPVDQIYSPFL